jgi:hypothetical protein
MGTKLGVKLLAGLDWNGTLKLKDSVAMRRFKQYVS